MKRITRGLTLSCLTAALLTPIAATASAAPHAVATAQGGHDERHDDCDQRYNTHDNGRFNDYQGGGLGLGLGLLIL